MFDLSPVLFDLARYFNEIENGKKDKGDGSMSFKVYVNKIAALVFLFAAGSLGFTSTALAAADSGPGSVTPLIWWLAPVASVLAIVFAYFFYRKMIRKRKPAMVIFSVCLMTGK